MESKKVRNIKFIILCSEKGGVAKTTSTYNLAYCLAKEGKKVLAVDFDSQANLSTCFGIEDTGVVPVTIGHLMMNRIEDEKLPDALEYIMSRNGVDFIPSSVMLSVVDAKLRLEMGAERMLAGILEPLKGRYDYILVDTCPSLGSLTINALAAADGVIITVNPQLLAMMGLQSFGSPRSLLCATKKTLCRLCGTPIVCASRRNICVTYISMKKKLNRLTNANIDNIKRQDLDVGEVIAQLDSLIKKYPALMDDSTTENIAALLRMNSDIQENKKIKEVLKID